MLKGYQRELPHWEIVHMVFIQYHYLAVWLEKLRWGMEICLCMRPQGWINKNMSKQTWKMIAVPLIQAKVIAHSSLMVPESRTHQCLSENDKPPWDPCLPKCRQLPKYHLVRWGSPQMLHKSPYCHSNVYLTPQTDTKCLLYKSSRLFLNAYQDNCEC